MSKRTAKPVRNAIGEPREVHPAFHFSHSQPLSDINKGHKNILTVTAGLLASHLKLQRLHHRLFALSADVIGVLWRLPEHSYHPHNCVCVCNHLYQSFLLLSHVELIIGERSEPTECSCHSRFVGCICIGRNFEISLRRRVHSAQK